MKEFFLARWLLAAREVIRWYTIWFVALQLRGMSGAETLGWAEPWPLDEDGHKEVPLTCILIPRHANSFTPFLA